jgi:hypothetical protein
MLTRTDALHDALERLTDYAFLDAPGFACHGPMGAETLSSLGHDDLVGDWVDEYKRRHDPLPAPPERQAIDPNDADGIRSALGDPSRLSDWAAMFRAAVWDRPWPDVLCDWAPKLLPGNGGALTHGLIRTAHAVRALRTQDRPSGALLTELATGLALWAGSFKVLPGDVNVHGRSSFTGAVGGLPRPGEPWPLFEAGAFSHIDELEGFSTAVDALGPPPSAEAALSSLSAGFCSIILAHPDVFAVPLVHMVTPIAAARTLLPYLPNVPVQRLYRQLWLVGATIIVSFTPSTGSQARPESDDVLAPEELVARAVAHRDPHALKFTDACVREHGLSSDPVYLRAASQVIGQLPAWRGTP